MAQPVCCHHGGAGGDRADGLLFVDNAFYIEAGKRFPQEEQLASFVGVYSAIMGTISLACSVLFAPWVLRRFGVRGGLMVLPGLLLAGSMSTVLAATFGGPADLLFFLVVGSQVIDQSFRYTLHKTTFVTLFQPLPAGQRIRVQAGLGASSNHSPAASPDSFCSA